MDKDITQTGIFAVHLSLVTEYQFSRTFGLNSPQHFSEVVSNPQLQHLQWFNTSEAVIAISQTLITTKLFLV